MVSEVENVTGSLGGVGAGPGIPTAADEDVAGLAAAGVRAAALRAAVEEFDITRWLRDQLVDLSALDRRSPAHA